MHNPQTCIGCRNCERNCPYGVISFNSGEVHPFWKDKLGQETVKKAGGKITPYYNPDVAFRKKGIVEKCTFCYEITTKGEQPYCSKVCPPSALVFGDLDDKNSDVSKLLKTYKATRLLEEKNTGPNVYYVREYISRK